MDRRKATWDGYAILTLIATCAILSILTPYSIVIVSITILILVHQILLRLIFRGPTKRSLPFSNKDWDIINLDNNGVDVYGYVNYQPNKSDMVVFVHGWQSSSEKFTERIQLFRNKGLHTLAHDMRGHGMAPDTPEWTAGKVIQDLKILLESVDQSKINKVHFFGHSLGAFICIGMHNTRHQGWWKDSYGTLMLESPMVAYSPIMKELTSNIPFMFPLFKRWAMKGFNKIHPEIGNIEWSDIDIPSWGVPKAPILLLQAENDSRLGRYHYDLLLDQDIEVYPHLLTSLTHSKNRVNEERDALILEWIDNKIL
ncbi:MAG: lysophospholipase [Candidatus Poseidoniaceae archaeon]|nr:lysophospholipase [Candidatus Poseidoniaceae archaeon]